jgi:hypothetical protein
VHPTDGRRNRDDKHDRDHASNQNDYYGNRNHPGYYAHYADNHSDHNPDHTDHDLAKHKRGHRSRWRTRHRSRR